MGVFINGNLLYTYARYFRVIEFGGRFGGGKTLAAFALAYEMCRQFGYRYILSNVNSIWTDNPEKIVLRENQYVDAVVILDEGGLFLKYGSDADSFLAGLRKLNIVILTPTFIPPSAKMSFVSVQRTINFSFIGVPYWHYSLKLSLGRQKESGSFGLLFPQKMWGLYDTLDFPTDDKHLSKWLLHWIKNIQAQRASWCDWGEPPGYKPPTRNGRSRESSPLDELGRDFENLIRIQEEAINSISVHANKKR
jgi:hypothetical protein